MCVSNRLLGSCLFPLVCFTDISKSQLYKQPRLLRLLTPALLPIFPISLMVFIKAETQKSSLIPPCPSALPIQPASEYVSIMCPLSPSAVMSSPSTIVSQLDDSSGLNGCPSPTLAPWICCWGCLSGFCPEVLPSSLSLPSVLPHLAPPISVAGCLLCARHWGSWDPEVMALWPRPKGAPRQRSSLLPLC